MQPFRTILLAADFSENSQDAFHLACSLAMGNGKRLIVLHVVKPARVSKTPDYLGQGSLPTSETEDGHEFLKRRMGEVYVPNNPIDVEYRTRDGDASVEIVRMADEIGADLIAMGTQGRTGLRSLLAGSVATTVLKKAHCPVLALRSGNRPYPAKEMRVILHPTDFSKASEAALQVARSLARDLGTRLVLLHVLPLAIYLEGEMAAERAPWDYQHSLDVARRRLDSPDLEYPVETRLSRGFEAEEILRLAQEVESDLIVMGTHGRTGVGRLLMGNTAESVLPRADCPVLVVKSAQGVPVSTSDRSQHKSTVVF